MIYRMKLWQKIFVVSFIISIILFGTCGFFVALNGNRLNLENRTNYLENYGETILASLEIDDSHTIDGIFNKLKEIKVIDETAFQVKKGNTIIYDLFNKNPNQYKYDFGYEIELGTTYTQNVGDSIFLYVETPFTYQGDSYVLVTIDSLDDIYDICNNQLRNLFNICVLLSLFSAVAMIIFARSITLPIKRINDGVKIVTQNQYGYRLDVDGYDELNELAGNFNMMCDAVEQNIHSYKMGTDNLVHEFKTPLTSIIGYAEILNLDYCSEEIKKEASQYILKEGRRLKDLVNKIINFMVIDIGQLEMECVPVLDIIKMAIASTTLSASLKNINVSYECKPDIYMFGDSVLMTTMLVNFIDNSIKATADDGNIHICVLDSELALKRITIQDYGSGIPKDEIDKVTEIFYMVDKSRNRKENGLGIGLSICKAIVDAHDAKLSIESDIGIGTTVMIDFPYSKYKSFKQSHSELPIISNKIKKEKNNE